MKNQSRKRLLFTLLISGLVLGGCSPQRTDALLNPSKMHKVKTKQKLDALLKDGDKVREMSYVDGDIVEAPGDSESNMGGADYSESNRDYVSTNLQDKAVDESDIIKTDGDYIYYVAENSNKFIVFEILDNHDIKIKHEIIEEDVHFSEMYLLNDYAVLYGVKQIKDDYQDGHYTYYYESVSTIFVYALDTMEKVYSLELNYNLITTRVVDRALYLVGNKFLYLKNDNEVPTALINDREKTELSYDDIYYFDETQVYGMTILGGIYLDANPAKITYRSEGFLGAVTANKKVYVNENNLYLCDSTYYYGSNSAYTSLTVSLFGLHNSDATISFKGSAIVKGAALNQFAMDEYQGYLRLATTDHAATWLKNIAGNIIWETYATTITNYLYILKFDAKHETFALVAHISEGLGKPGETIRSVRFAGNKGYIVTFVRTDPLYVIDLSYPQEPVITDALELPGYDTYQHPWGESALIGLGYNATSGGLITGIKVTAYNTTSGSASELQTKNVTTKIMNGDSFSNVYSEALTNHKAILVSPAHGIFGFPVYAYAYTYDEYTFTQTYHSEYVLYRIDFTEDKPISELVRIEHEPAANGQRVPIRRAVLIDGFIYTFSNRSVVSYDLVNNVISKNILQF